MTGAELPLSIPRQLRDEHTDPAESALEIPAPLGRWVAVLTLWPVIDQHYHQLAARCFGDGLAMEWKAFALVVSRTGIAEPGPQPDTFVFRPEWAAALEPELEGLGGGQAIRTRLVEAWAEEPDLHLVDEITAWARGLSRWDLFERVWLLLGEQTTGLSRPTLEVFRDLPLEARYTHPILTWASGAAASLLAGTPRQESEAVLQRLMLDSAMLHADWSVREHSDEAVSAGTFRMIGERRLPSTRVGQSLEAAWRTKQEVDAFIDARSRQGRSPGRTPQAIFRAFSARLALFRHDPLGAVEEARWATILADWEPVAVIASGVDALARSLSSDDEPSGLPAAPAALDDGLGVRGLRGMGQLYALLALGNHAVRRLDRDALEDVLALVSADEAALAGVWSVRAALVAWQSALWGDPELGVSTLAAEVQRLSMLGREQDEPLGEALLARARVGLLTRAGAFGAATQVVDAMPAHLRLASRALVHVWAGQYAQAVRLADAGPYEEGLETTDRHRLALLRSGAALLDGSADDAMRRDALRELNRLLATSSFAHLALLPTAAREALLTACGPELDAADPRLGVLRERLAGLNDSGDGGARPLHLTERETVLLPLLATDESVPDIARRLHVSVNTVRKQVVTLREKFQADSRAELVRRARTYGALP